MNKYPEKCRTCKYYVPSLDSEGKKSKRGYCTTDMTETKASEDACIIYKPSFDTVKG